MNTRRILPAVIAALVLAAVSASLRAQQETGQPPDDDGAFRFRSGVELINVTTTVSDSSGRFVPGLTKEDFTVFEDDQPVELTHFSAEHVPVSLGIVLDASGSMAGNKIEEAQRALSRFLYDLLDRDDEIFIYRFSNYPVLLQEWTTDRRLLSRMLDRVTPNGGTAMYDAVAAAVPLAEQGQHRKKALLVISDGNDTSSQTSVRELKQQIRESEVLVYAIGIDGDEPPPFRRTPRTQPPPRLPIPLPFPFPGRPRPFGQILGAQRSQRVTPSDDRVNVAALRDMTDDSGGRTEVIRDARDLNPATASIADELSQQYYLGYQASGKRDGRWHSIRVEVRNNRYVVRARKGYIAS
jgi:Ca-activated chloride channel family protein